MLAEAIYSCADTGNQLLLLLGLRQAQRPPDAEHPRRGFRGAGGLVLAFAFVVLASVTGDLRFDAYGSLAIGVLLVIVAIFVATRVKQLLIGRSAEPSVVARIEAELGADPAVLRVYRVITIQIGSEIMLAAKVHLREGLSIDAACAKINRLERRLACPSCAGASSSRTSPTDAHSRGSAKATTASPSASPPSA